MSDDHASVIAQADSALLSISPLAGSFSFGLAARSIEQTRGDLLDSVRPSLSLRLSGDPVVSHEVRVDVFARLLSSLQESITSVAQAIAGKITTRSAIPGPLRELTALRLAVTFPSSFGAVLRAPEPQSQRELPGLPDNDDLLKLSIETVLEIVALAESEGVEDEPIVEAILPLGARSFKHLSDLSRVISEAGMSAAFTWSYPGTSDRAAALTASTAVRLGDVLARNQIAEELADIEGRLGTVSDIRNRIELQTDDGSLITASVIEELVTQLGRYFTHRVAASFEITTARSIVTGRERKSYRLVGLVMADGSHDRVMRFAV